MHTYIPGIYVESPGSIFFVLLERFSRGFEVLGVVTTTVGLLVCSIKSVFTHSTYWYTSEYIVAQTCTTS